MRLLSITPITVTETELARRQARYDKFAPTGLTVVLRNLNQPAPRALDQQSDVIESDTCLARDLETIDLTRFDAVLPDCVLDPGFRQNQDPLIVGMLESVVSHLASAGHKIGAVTRNPAIGAELVRRISEYGFDKEFVGLEVLNLSFDAISDDATWNSALRRALVALEAKGATAVINGCSAVDVDESGLKLKVVDPTELALQLIADRKVQLS